MHRIYFEKRCLTICSEDDAILSDPNTLVFYPHSDNSFGQIAQMARTMPSLHHIYIPSPDPDSCYRGICHEFKEVNAAGGLVSNLRGDFLLIRRNNLWDLPKGHQEEGEDISITAIREVQEETGVEDLILRDLICITDHCYIRDGIWHLKHTWWYNMLYPGPVDLSPQLEEDIAKAAWVAKSSLPPYITNTYPSIQEVFRNAGV